MSSGFIQPDFVGGPVQFFRRRCLEDIDGYAPYGHSDCIAVFKARMRGWEVRCFPEIYAFHHDQPGNSIREKVPSCFRMGRMDHLMGGLLVFETARCLLRMMQKPFVVAGAAMLAGFLWARLCGEPVRIPQDIVSFLRADQKQKLLEGLPFLSLHRTVS